VNHVTSSLRQTATGRRRLDNSASLSDRREDTVGLAGGVSGEERGSRGLENVVTEEHQADFRLRVRFLTAGESQSPRRAGSATTRTTTRTTSVDALTVQHHLTDRSDEAH